MYERCRCPRLSRLVKTSMIGQPPIRDIRLADVNDLRTRHQYADSTSIGTIGSCSLNYPPSSIGR